VALVTFDTVLLESQQSIRKSLLIGPVFQEDRCSYPTRCPQSPQASMKWRPEAPARGGSRRRQGTRRIRLSGLLLPPSCVLGCNGRCGRRTRRNRTPTLTRTDIIDPRASSRVVEKIRCRLVDPPRRRAPSAPPTHGVGPLLSVFAVRHVPVSGKLGRV
jgi:hypothetical protein